MKPFLRMMQKKHCRLGCRQLLGMLDLSSSLQHVDVRKPHPESVLVVFIFAEPRGVQGTEGDAFKFTLANEMRSIFPQAKQFDPELPSEIGIGGKRSLVLRIERIESIWSASVGFAGRS